MPSFQVEPMNLAIGLCFNAIMVLNLLGATKSNVSETRHGIFKARVFPFAAILQKLPMENTKSKDCQQCSHAIRVSKLKEIQL